MAQTCILSELYHSTNGDDWLDKTGWNDGADVCKWGGIKCNENKEIIKINLSKF